MIINPARSFNPGSGTTNLIFLTIAIAYIGAFVSLGTALGVWPWMALIALGCVHIGLYVVSDKLTHGRFRSLWAVIYYLLQLLVCGCIQFIGKGSFWLLLLPLASSASFLLTRKALIVLLIGLLVDFVIPIGWENLVASFQSAMIFSSALVFVLVFTEVGIQERLVRREKEAVVRELEEANRHLRDYAAQAEELARTRERNRLAREIHDSIGHSLTVVNIQIEVAKALVTNRGWKEAAPDLFAALEKAQALTRNGLEDARRSVAALRAGPIGEKPLIEALKTLTTDGRDAGLLVELVTGGNVRPLPPSVELVLYRVAQEALTNARKHARASRATVDLAFEENMVRLVVSDNGVGMQSEINGEGKFGLRGLQERVDVLKGKMEIASPPEGGVRLMVELPIGDATSVA